MTGVALSVLVRCASIVPAIADAVRGLDPFLTRGSTGGGGPAFARCGLSR
jgi:hypothetical protein